MVLQIPNVLASYVLTHWHCSLAIAVLPRLYAVFNMMQFTLWQFMLLHSVVFTLCDALLVQGVLRERGGSDMRTLAPRDHVLWLMP